MRQDALARVMAELSVDQGGEPVAQMLLGGCRSAGLASMPLTRSRPLLPGAAHPRQERALLGAGLRGAVLQGLAQLGAAAVDPAADGAELHAEGRGDLLVRQSLDVAEHHGGAELRREGVQRLLDVRVEVGVVEDLLRGRLTAGQPLGRVVAEGVEADALLAPDHVQEEVGGDAVQPALEGAGRVRRQRAEDADEDLLGEVLGVVLVAGQAVGEAVDPAAVRADDLLPGGRSPRLRVRVGGEGRGRCGVGGVDCGQQCRSRISARPPT